MKASERDFSPDVTRMGSAPSKVSFTLVCSACGHVKTLESIRNLPDSAVARKFKQWGWLLGRKRRDDLCPRCVGVKAENRLADRFRVVNDEGPVASRFEFVDRLERERDETASAAHPAAIPCRSAAEPDHEKPPPEAGTDSDPRLQDTLSALVDLQRQTVRELREMRATWELTLEAMSEMGTLARHQTEAVSRLAALVGRAASNASDNRASIASDLSRIQELLSSLDLPRKLAALEALAASRRTRSPEEQDLAVPVPEASDGSLETMSAARATSEEAQATMPAHDETDARIASSGDRKRGRYYTTISIPNALWDAAFADATRFEVTKAGNRIMVAQAKDGGIGIKSRSRSRTVVQTTKLGSVAARSTRIRTEPGRLTVEI